MITSIHQSASNINSVQQQRSTEAPVQTILLLITGFIASAGTDCSGSIFKTSTLLAEGLA